MKKLIAAQTGTNAQKIVLKKWYTAFKDHVQLQDYEINDGMVSTPTERTERRVALSSWNVLDAELTPQSLEMY